MSVSDEEYEELTRALLEQDEALQMRDELLLAERQKALYKLVDMFMVFCEELDIQCFAIANTLRGAVIYNKLIPGEINAELGILRDDYYKLASIVDECIQAEVDLPFVFEFTNGDGSPSIRPYIRLKDLDTIYLPNGDHLYDEDHMPAVANPRITFSILDNLPDDEAATKYLLLKSRIANALLSADGTKKSGVRVGGQKLRVPGAAFIPKRPINDYLWKHMGLYNDIECESVTRLLGNRSETLPKEDIFPLQKIPFGTGYILGPRVTRTWIEDDLEKVNKNTAILQQDALAILTEIDRICRKHNIGYFVCGGTMLGYVRHGGFIPWDDDIDVGMLRDDYERFTQIAAGELDERFFLQTRESDPGIPYLFSKVRMNNSEYITKYNEHRDYHKGICVDLFPFDKVPNDRAELEAFVSEVRGKSAAHNRIANNQVAPYRSAKKDHPFADGVGNAIYRVKRAFYMTKSMASTQEKYHETATRYRDDETCQYVASFVPTFTMIRLDELLPYRDVDFEGLMVKVPARPDLFLQMQYGDYMRMPMPHQQQGHGLLWWSDPEHDSREM